MGPVNEQLGEEIRSLQARYGVTNQRLADAAGVSKRSIERSLYGKRDMTLDELYAVAYELGTTARDILASVEAKVPDRIRQTLEAYLSPEDRARITEAARLAEEDQEASRKRRQA